MLRLKQSSPRACWLVGHRGAMGYAPENTLASFALAQRMGAEFVECDVHLSKDRRCIVMHDEALERTTPARGLIRDRSAKEILALDSGSWFGAKFKGERVLTLDSLLLWAKGQSSLSGFQMGVAVEIKNEPVRYLDIEKEVLASVAAAGMESRVILISFDHGVVKRAKARSRKVATGMLFDRPLQDPVARARALRADALFPRRNLVTKELVAKAHRRGLAVATWTVNESAEMKQLLACGVDAIASNFPDRLEAVLEKRKKRRA